MAAKKKKRARGRKPPKRRNRLIKGTSNKTRSRNIRTERRAGKSPQQSAAIAYRIQREAKKKKAAAKRRKTIRAEKKRGRRPKTNPRRVALSPRWYEKILASQTAQRLARTAAARDSVHTNAAWWRLPARERASRVLVLWRRGGRARRGAVALARAEQKHCEGPPRRRSNPRTDDEALRRYRQLHWGLRGRGGVAQKTAADPRAGTAVKLGQLRSVTYRTTKRGDGLSDYVHDFEGPYPDLLVNEGGLIIAGGRYSVPKGGITG